MGLDAGAMPVGEHDRLVGMITDRDIAIRGVAEGKDPAKIREVMSTDVKYCYDDEGVEHVLHNMGELQVRRLPVLNRNKRLIGIVSLGDLATNGQAAEAGQALSGISRSATLQPRFSSLREEREGVADREVNDRGDEIDLEGLIGARYGFLRRARQLEHTDDGGERGIFDHDRAQAYIGRQHPADSLREDDVAHRLETAQTASVCRFRLPLGDRLNAAPNDLCSVRRHP